MPNRTAASTTYKKLLTSTNELDLEIVAEKLVVPEFQRSYVWKNNNIKEIIQSIKENDFGYYLGNLVIINSIGRQKIIDGQQRLVTLSLIANALVNIIENDEIKVQLEKIIYFDKETNGLRIKFDKENLDITYNKLITREAFVPTDDSQKILYSANRKITQEIGTINNIDEFAEKILRLEFVVIKCDTDDDVYQLFEGLNSTGLSLSAVDLIKSAILGKAKSLGTDTYNTIRDCWLEMESKFELSNNIWFKKFIRHRWFGNGGYVSSGALYGKIKNTKIQDTTTEDLVIFLNELNNDANKYISLRKGELRKGDFSPTMPDESWRSISKIIKNITHFDNLDQIYGLLLALHKFGVANESYFQRDVFEKHIKKIWSILVILKYSKTSPSEFERDFAQICNYIKDKSYGDFKATMNMFFTNRKLELESLREEFIRNFSTKIDCKIDDRDLVRHFLMDYLLVDGGGQDSGTLEIEHIVPENNLTEWANISDIENTKLNVGKIGNLTLLSGSINRDIGHQNFDYKHINGYALSAFIKNTQLNEEWGSQFNSNDPVSNAILPRGQIIAGSLFDLYLNTLVR